MTPPVSLWEPAPSLPGRRLMCWPNTNRWALQEVLGEPHATGEKPPAGLLLGPRVLELNLSWDPLPITPTRLTGLCPWTCMINCGIKKVCMTQCFLAFSRDIYITQMACWLLPPLSH